MGGTAVEETGCTLEGSVNVPAQQAGPAPNGGEIVLAVDEVFTGNESDPDGWTQLGYNLDCLITDKSSTDVCRAAPDGTVWPDAAGGRDNNFGYAILPLLGDALDANGRIDAGEWTLVLRFPALRPESTQVDVVAEIYDGRALGHPPSEMDVWPVADRRELVGYVTDNTWVSGTPVTLRLAMTFYSEPIFLTLYRAIITAKLAPDRSSASQGQIAGIVDPDELSFEVGRVGAIVEPGTCGISQGPLDLREGADIMLDGTQSPNKTCDGISAGFGFTMKPAALGEQVEVEAVPPHPCPPGS